MNEMEEKLMYLVAIISSVGVGLFLGAGQLIAALIFILLTIAMIIARDTIINIFKEKKAVSK